MKNLWLDKQESDYQNFKEGQTAKETYKFKDEFLRLVPKESRVLDAGCGNGWFLAWLKEQGYPLVEGIDVSPTAVAETNGRGVHAHLMDGHATDFEDGLFDAVSASHVLEHSPCPKALLRELVRITKGDGLIFIEAPIQKTEDSGGGGHFTFFESTDEIDALLKKEGTEIIYSRFGTPIYTDHYVVVGRVKK